MMLWRPTLAAGLALLVALPVDRLAPALPSRSAARAPLLVLATLVAVYVLFATPWLALALGVTLAFAAARRPALAPLPHRRAPLAPLLATLVAFLTAMLVDRPAIPCFWDAFVWLGKARYAAGGLGRLVAGGLGTTLPPFIPSGYPLFEPLGVALLAGLSPRPESVVAGSIGLEALTLALFVCSAADADGTSAADRRARLATVTVVLLSSPLVLVHLRSSYVDLPLGLLVGTLGLLLRRRGAGLGCVIVAMAAAALKDEGMVHVAALSLAALAGGLAEENGRGRALAGRAVAALAAAVAVTASWHLRLKLSGIENSDHALSVPDIGRVRALAQLAVEHLVDVRSWGAFWMLGGGAVLGGLVRPSRGSRHVRWFATLLVVDGVVLFASLLATPGRVMEFAAGGTLLNRLYVQMAPTAALLIGSWAALELGPPGFKAERSPVQG